MANKELKSCPFCRQRPEAEHTEVEINTDKEWWVICRNPLCVIKPTTSLHADRDSAVTDWNYREKK